jgi:hypothetical protein
LKKPQQEELQKAFEEIKEYPNPSKFLKCHKNAKNQGFFEKTKKSMSLN